MSKTVYMRGLQVFIADIRAAPNKEAEQKRVEKELAKIRARFGEDKPLTGYDRRKYIWKLLYIYMLGYDIEFGHRQACDLIPAPKYSDKQVGYMACSLLLRENDDFLRLAINGIHMDLISRNEAFHCLALGFVSNMAGPEMAEALTQDVIKLLQSGSSRPIVKKKAALCLLRLLRKTPLDQIVIQPDSFCSTLTALLEERDLGLLLSSITLLLGICSRTGAAGYEPCQARVIKVLERLVANKDIPADYTYYAIASPWLQCKCLHMLQFFPAPEGAAERKALNDCLAYYINKETSDVSHKSSNQNKANAQHAMLFEAIALVLHLESDKSLLTASVSTLGKFLSYKEPNIKYLALENMARLALLPEIAEAIRKHKSIVLASLKDADVSIRRRAMDLLFTMCDAATADDIVGELLKNLTLADITMREELVLKIAILAEKFAPTVHWYVDVVLQLLEHAGEHVSEDIWHRVVMLITNNESMQQYAAHNCVEVLRRGCSHESLVSVAAYVLGEYGRLIISTVPPLEQHKVLHAVFPGALQSTKGLLMTAFIKIYLLDPTNATLKRDTMSLFEKYKKLLDAELQQRATEYLAMANNPAAASASYMLPMPKWQERESTLLRRLQRHEGVESLSDTPATLGLSDVDGNGGQPPVVQAPVSLALSGGSSEQGVGAGFPSKPSVASPSAVQQPGLHQTHPSQDLAGAGSFALQGAGLQQSHSSHSYGAPPPRQQPVDLLSDLFSDGLSVGPASAASAAPLFSAAGAPSSSYGMPPAANANPFAATPQAYGPPLAYEAPPSHGTPQPAPANPFAVPPQHQQRQHSGPQPSFSNSPALGLKGTASSGFDDPFGDHAFGAPPPPPPLPAVVDPPRLTGNLQQWFNNLLRKDRGILYEDQYLQVGVQSQYGFGRGDVVLFFGNKHPEYELTHLVCDISSSPAVSITVGAVPQQLAPMQQLQVPLQVLALAPLEGPPPMQLGYSIGSTMHRQDLALPVANHKFLVPEPNIQREVFFEQWKVYGAPPQKAQEMVERATPLPAESALALMRGIHLGAEHGYLDPSPHNEAGAASFVFGQPTQQSILVLCRLEGNPQTRQQFRVTVSSASPILSNTLKDLLAQSVRAAT